MRAVVTGATGGLGGACALALARAGADVALGYHRDAAGAERVAGAVRVLGRRALPLALDVADADATGRAIGAAIAELGGLDVVVNAAAWSVDALAGELSAEAFARCHAVHVAGILHVVRPALPALLASGRGRVINFSSVLAARAVPGAAAYVAAKGGVEALTRALAVELGGKRITVNAVAPGFIAAGLGEAPLARAGRALEQAVPARRAGRPDEVAAVVAFLASEAASYVNGVVLAIDGGLGAGSRHLRAAPGAEP